MNWKLMLLGLAIAGAAILGWLWLGLAPLEHDLFELTILHTNDVHAQYAIPPQDNALGGAARLATAVRTVRQEEPNVLLLDAGDQFQGSLLFTVAGARVVSDVMNHVGYDAMCLGNHEFDAGPAELAQFIQQARFPVLSANVDAQADRYLAGRILPYALFTFGRQTVAVFGLTTEDTAVTSSPGPNVQFNDVVRTAQQTVLHLKAQGINIIIALTHLGYERDLELANAVHGIDVIVGGHSHTHLHDYPTVVRPNTDRSVLVVTAHEWGSHLGRLDITFRRDGSVAGYQGQLLPMDASVSPDTEMQTLLSVYEQELAHLMKSIVGATDVPLHADREDVRSRETNLGNLICDALLWRTRTLGTCLALQNAGGIRASIPRGMVTLAHVLDVLPFGNQITVLSLSGHQVVAALEHGVGGVQAREGRFLQVAGLRYTFDPSEDAGSRILSVEIWDRDLGTHVPINLEHEYIVATNHFLARGGDGFSMLAEAAAHPGSYQTGWLLSTALAEYLDVHSPVAPSEEGRILQDSPSGS